MNSGFILFTGLALVAVALGSFALYEAPEISIFAMEFYSAESKGGGDRYYNATLDFEDDVLISGIQTYTRRDLGQESLEVCYLNVTSLNWSDSETGGKCTIIYELPLSLAKLRTNIALGLYHPIDNCPLDEICYNIIEK